jgi:hypothetical protein
VLRLKTVEADFNGRLRVLTDENHLEVVNEKIKKRVLASHFEYFQNFSLEKIKAYKHDVRFGTQASSDKRKKVEML